MRLFLLTTESSGSESPCEERGEKSIQVDSTYPNSLLAATLPSLELLV